MNNCDFEKSLKQLELLDIQIKNSGCNFGNLTESTIVNCTSNLDVYDYLFSILFGICGACITTNDNIAKFLDQIHKSSNSGNMTGNKIQDFFAKMLNHSGDYIDQVPVMHDDGVITNEFVNRAAKEMGENIYVGKGSAPHRIFWGHDIFSFGKDNPFYLSIKQYGVGKGIIQAFRHLVADTCSKQGLPLPFHSLFDYSKANGNVGNLLLDFCQKYSQEIFGRKQPGGNNEVFNHLFSVHMQDVGSQGLVAALAIAYFKARGIDDQDRRTQFRIICYSINFYGACIIGTCKTGIPYINWPSLAMVIKQVYKLIRINSKDIKQLQRLTESLVNNGVILEQEVNKITNDIGIYISYDDYVNAYKKEQKETKEMIKFLLEE